MFTPIQQLLPATISRFGVKNEVDAAQVCEKYRQVAHIILHPDALDFTYPKSYRKKVFTIGIESPAWAQVISEKKDLLKKALNDALGASYINTIKTAVVNKSLTQAN